jgi:hypothetical protein
MTAQATEYLFIDGVKHQMHSLPFNQYLKTLNPKIEFAFHSTACMRGYYGTWEISNNMLFLTFLQAYASIEPEKILGIKDFFPQSSGKVKAEWFSGTLRIPLSGESEYFHGGFGHVYDSYLRLEVMNGDFVSTSVFHESQKEKTKPMLTRKFQLKPFRFANVIEWINSRLK